MDNKAKKEKLKILFVSSEVSPYIKSGGLGEVSSSLPKALLDIGIDIRIVFPKYSIMDEKYINDLKYIETIQIKLNWRNPNASILKLNNAYNETYLIENDYYFGRDYIYGFEDDYERFAFFSKSVVEMLPIIDFKPDVIHFNDWQTALGCIYLKDRYKEFPFYSNIKSLFTIHNLQYQGNFESSVLPEIDLNYGYFVSDKLEYYNQINYMKAGLAYSDYISTVSPTYSKEIQTEAYGYGLNGLINSRNATLAGILNGIDYDVNNPKTNNKIFKNYSIENIEDKLECKRDIQIALGLPKSDAPVFSIISRFAEQKGIDLIIQSMEYFLQKDIQIVILGTGNQHFENTLISYVSRFPKKISVNIGFDDTLASKIYAGSDFFLMPSLFEPCGLGQIISMRYGTIPIVRHTGGLYDTVSHYNYETREGNGFLFKDYLSSALIWAFNEGLNLYYNKEHFDIARINAMKSDYSWEKSAIEYINLYNKICLI